MAVRVGRSSGQWVVEFEQAGVRVHKRLPKGTTESQAHEWERQARKRIFDEETLGRRPTLTIQQAIDVWLRENQRTNQKQARSEAGFWQPWGNRPLSEAGRVSQEAKETWAKPYVPAGKVKPIVVSKSTVNARLALLKAACKHVYQREMVAENHSGRIKAYKLNNRKDVYLTKAQVATLARNATGSMRGAIWVLAYAGLRATELLAMTESSMRRDSLEVVGKGNKRRYVPIAPALRPWLRCLPLPLSYWQLRDGFDEARKKAGLPTGVTLHTLRHTCASWLINAGVDLYTVGRILGHSSPLTTARYAHLADASLKKAMRKLK